MKNKQELLQWLEEEEIKRVQEQEIRQEQEVKGEVKKVRKDIVEEFRSTEHSYCG